MPTSKRPQPLSPKQLYKLNRKRNARIAQEAAANKQFPDPTDPDIVLTDVPADFVHPVKKLTEHEPRKRKTSKKKR